MYADHDITSFVNAAGINAEDGSIMLSEEAWDRTFTVNARGTSLCSKYAGAQMRKQEQLPTMDRGWIINIAGIQTGSSKQRHNYPKVGSLLTPMPPSWRVPVEALRCE